MSDERFLDPEAAGSTRGPRDSATAPEDERLGGLPADETDARAREAAAQERYLRALADFDNYRKRVAREREDWRRQAQIDVLREILPVLDNFDRALAAEPGGATASGFRAGVELIRRDFLSALERVGVRPFVSVGEPFDPQRHEAVARVERADLPDHTVMSETLRGYLFQDRVLRPARVVVAVDPRADADGASR